MVPERMSSFREGISKTKNNRECIDILCTKRGSWYQSATPSETASVVLSYYPTVSVVVYLYLRFNNNNHVSADSRGTLRVVETSGNGLFRAPRGCSWRDTDTRVSSRSCNMCSLGPDVQGVCQHAVNVSPKVGILILGMCPLET